LLRNALDQLADLDCMARIVRKKCNAVCCCRPVDKQHTSWCGVRHCGTLHSSWHLQRWYGNSIVRITIWNMQQAHVFVWEVKITYCVDNKYSSINFGSDVCWVHSILTSWLGASVVWSRSKYLIFRPSYMPSQNCEKRLLASSYISVRPSICPSAHPHGTTRLVLDGFSRNLMSVFFENLSRKFKSY